MTYLLLLVPVISGVCGALAGIWDGKKLGVQIFEESLEKVTKEKRNKVEFESYEGKNVSLLIRRSTKN